MDAENPARLGCDKAAPVATRQPDVGKLRCAVLDRTRGAGNAQIKCSPTRIAE